MEQYIEAVKTENSTKFAKITQILYYLFVSDTPEGCPYGAKPGSTVIVYHAFLIRREVLKCNPKKHRKICRASLSDGQGFPSRRSHIFGTWFFQFLKDLQDPAGSGLCLPAVRGEFHMFP